MSSVHSITSVLGKRRFPDQTSRHQTSRRELEERVEALVERNIRQGCFSFLRIPVEASLKMARSGPFLALRQGEKLSLWDVCLGKRLWTHRILNPLYPPDPRQSGLKVDATGVVVQYFEHGARLCEPSQIRMFSERGQTGCVNLSQHQRIVGWHLSKGSTFGLSVNPEESQTKYSLHEWNELGQCVRQISLTDLAENCNLMACVNDDYAVVCGGTNLPAVPSKVFVLDRIKGSTKVWDLELSEDEIRINSVALQGDFLIVGWNYLKKSPLNQEADPQITGFNLVTGDNPIRISCARSGRVLNLIAEGRWVSFRVDGTVYILDLWKKATKKCWEIPRVLLAETRISSSITGSSLTICYPNVISGELLRVVIDLTDGRCIQSNSEDLVGYSDAPMTFEAGVLVQHRGRDICVKNFLNEPRPPLD